MKKSIAVLASYLPENVAFECAVSAVLVVGCAVVGFLSRSMMIDIQTSVLFLI